MPHTLRPINVARINAEEPRIPSPARNDNPSPQSIPVYLVSDGKIIGANPSSVILHQAPSVHMPIHVASPSIGTQSPNSGVQVIDDGGEDSISGKKVKLLCSYGGKILPRPSDGMLRYVGGQTRIITVRRDVSFSELVQKMVNACGQVAVMKYQLPNEDLDALVSVSCSDDLENMMEEYDKLLERSVDGSVKLRVFLFTASELDSSGMMHFGDLQDSSQKYVDAVNGVLEVAGAGAAMKESISSATSTQNSDISVADANDQSLLFAQDMSSSNAPSPRSDSTDAALRSGCFDANLATLGYDLQQTAIKGANAPYLQGLMDAPQDTISSKEYQMFPSHLIYTNPAPRPILLHPQHHMSVNPNGYKAGYAPQLMPYQNLTMPKDVQQKDDCSMCQKQLPHAHSDTMVQEQRSAATHDVNTIYQSLQLDDIARLGASKELEAKIEDQRVKDDIVDKYSQGVVSEGNEVHAMVSPNDLETMFANRNIQSSMAASNYLFNNDDPWNFLQDSPLPPIPSKIVARKELFVPIDPLLDSSSSKDVEPIQEHIQDPIVLSNRNDQLEQMMCNKVSHDLINLELQAITEEEIASVLQSPLNSADIPVPDANQEKDAQFNIDAVIQAKLEGMNVKPQKANLAFPRDDGLGRLQIIKNIDLEELRELGSGTFGIVYHGKWRGTDVAIKRINNRCFVGKPSEQERMIDDFWNEAIKLAALHHPNVVAFYGVVLDGPGGSVATVTEFMVNGSLRTALQKNERTLDKRKRLLIAMDVAFGMEYLHSRNIVHFDLKSDNLLVNLRDTQRPICKVGDLGLSKVKCQTLISGGVRGTLPWMAPELLNGSSSLVSEKVDVFSFGIVMWELLTGEEPYGDLHYGAIIGGIVSNTLRPTMPDNCDPDWKLLMEKCWSAEPSERPSFTEITDELRLMAAKLPPKSQTSSPRTNAAHAV